MGVVLSIAGIEAGEAIAGLIAGGEAIAGSTATAGEIISGATAAAEVIEGATATAGEVITGLAEGLGVDTLSGSAGTVSGAISSLAGIPAVSGAISETVSGLLEGITFSEIASSIIGEEGAGILSGFEQEALVSTTISEAGLELTAVTAEMEGELTSLVSKTVEQIGLGEAETTGLNSIASRIKDNITFGLFKKILAKLAEGAITYEAGKEFMALVFGDDKKKSVVVIQDNKVKLNNDLSPFELATKIMDITNKVINGTKMEGLKTEDEVIKEVENQFTHLNFADRIFSESLWGYIKKSVIFQSGHLELFNEILKVYNGKNMKVWEEYNPDTKRNNYFVQDETGLIEVYYKKPNPNSVTTFHGIFAGPWSYNNSLPIDIFDTFTCSHDISYQDGFFNLIGDMKLVSRCIQNLDQVDFKLRAMMLSTAKYFASAGITLSAMTGRTSKINKANVNLLEGDIFDKYKTKPENEPENEFRLNVVSAKQDFYEEMGYLYQQNFIDYMLKQNISYENQELENNNNYDNNLLADFDKIPIVLI